MTNPEFTQKAEERITNDYAQGAWTQQEASQGTLEKYIAEVLADILGVEKMDTINEDDIASYTTVVQDIINDVAGLGF